MIFFGNIFASSYKYYSQKKDVDAFFQAKLIIVITQTLLILLILLIINEYAGFHVFQFLSKYKFIVIALYALILFLNIKYYTKEKMNLCIQNFEKKSLIERKLWAFITAITPFVPLILFYLILRFRHPL